MLLYFLSEYITVVANAMSSSLSNISTFENTYRTTCRSSPLEIYFTIIFFCFVVPFAPTLPLPSPHPLRYSRPRTYYSLRINEKSRDTSGSILNHIFHSFRVSTSRAKLPCGSKLNRRLLNKPSISEELLRVVLSREPRP